MRSLVSSFLQDVRHAARLWCSTPGLSLAVVTSLTLSIGAATAVFTFFDVVLLRPLPVPNPHELYAVGLAATANLNLNPRYFSLDFYRQLTAADPAFRDLFASSMVISSGVHLSTGGVAERLRAELVSGNYFRVLGIPATLGRTLNEEDDRAAGARPVAVLSDAAWHQQFGGRTDIVGQTVRVNGYPYTVIGVTGEGFFGTRVGLTPDLWIPLSMTAQIAGDTSPSRDTNYIELMLRAAPGTSRVALESALSAASRAWMAGTSTASPDSVANRQPPALRLVPAGRGLSLLRGQYGQPLVILLSAVGMLLLIACTNVANLLLARGIARQREMAIRLSQGATRLRIARQLVTESLLLTVIAGACGWLAANIVGHGLLAFLPASAATWQFSPDVRAFLFTSAVVTLAGLGFGLVPSRIAARLDLSHALRKDTVVGRLPFTRLDGQSALSMLQVALSLVLVAASILFTRTVQHIRSERTGFVQEHVLLAELDPVKSGYPEERARVFYGQLLARLRAQPDVRGAGLAAYGSLSGVRAAGGRFVNTPMHAEGQELPPAVDATVYLNNVTPGYFETVGMALHRGRDFTPQDGSGGPKVAIISETAARYFFGDADPVGRRIGAGRSGAATLEVVGVVGDAKYLNLREEPRRVVYRPHAQAFRSLMTLHVSTAANPATLGPMIQRVVGALDPAVPVFNLQTMEGRIDESLRQERLVMTLISGLSVLGTMLAVVGVYGVVSYAVTRRRRELAIRIAVGASPGHVAFSVLKRSVQIALGGLAVGIPLALWSRTLYSTLLFGGTSVDGAVVPVAAVVVALLAVAAGYFPARRAVRIDPLVALRDE